MKQQSTITDEFLESLAFFHDAGYPPHVRLIHTNGYTLESWRRYTDSNNERRWILNGQAVNPAPETKADVKQLLKRIRR